MADKPASPAAPAAPAAPASPAPTAPAAPAAAPVAPAAPAPPATPADPVRDFDAKLTAAFDKVSPLPPATPAAPAAPAAPTAPAAPAPPKPSAPANKQPKELRAELDRVSGELTAKQTQISEMEKKIADWEKKGKDTEALSGRLKTLEQQLETIQAENRALKHESSPEFKEKFEKPFNDAAAYAEKVVSGLEITDPETRQTRAATFDDFMDVYRQPTFNKAVKRANELFGEGAQVVINHLSELQRLQYVRDNALEDERKHAKEREQAEVTRRTQEQEHLSGLYTQVNKELADSVEEYHDDPTDKDLVDARQEGFRLFDARTSTPDQRILKNAHIRHRFAAYGPLRLKNMRLQQQLAEMKKELDSLKNEPPDPTRRPGGRQTAAPTDDWDSAARKELT